MKKHLLNIFLSVSFVFLFLSCSKGYEVRFTNYYIEPMDSVVIGDRLVVFKNIALKSATGYEKIQNGKHQVTCITKKKKRFYSTVTISKTGGGKKSIQLDAISNFSVLED